MRIQKVKGFSVIGILNLSDSEISISKIIFISFGNLFKNYYQEKDLN